MNPASEVIADLIRTLEGECVQYAIGGSFASSVWGVPRQTNDLDLVVHMDREAARRFSALVKDDYAVSHLEDAFDETGDVRCFQLLHFEQLFKVDVFLLSDSPYVEDLFARRRKQHVCEGCAAAFLSPEDTVIAKLRWFELGNCVSDKQWNDIVQVLEIQKGNLDEGYLDRWAEHFGVLELLNDARSQTFD